MRTRFAFVRELCLLTVGSCECAEVRAENTPQLHGILEGLPQDQSNTQGEALGLDVHRGSGFRRCGSHWQLCGVVWALS